MEASTASDRSYTELADVLPRASKILKSIGNQRRLEILTCLSKEELSVGELERKIQISQSALSQHLGRLRRDDIVTTRREAQTIYYSLYNDNILKLLNSIHITAAQA
ncbi:ArsR/SmtB family transcription factor [Sneathiella aquimaris]|uniref:ArsR/SmtB family transcription factor n=1 Tax=Sneathiella aquimaris TaxID=2599305 RepID=UPI00146E2A71|nr:metalloregulator ArsR/SmtB family transcription factor [Sneathiella aquimaris]